MRAVLALLVSVAVTAVPPAASADTVRRRVAGTPASIALPTSWRTLTRSQVLNGALPAGIRANPQLAPILRALRSSPALRLFAFDPQTTAGFATNVNTLVTPQPGVTFPRFAAQIAYELDHGAGGLRPVGRPTHRRVTLPAGPAVLATLRLRVSVRGTIRIASVRQYGLLRGGRGYVFTFTTLASTRARYAPTFDTAARSIRFT